MTIMEIASSVLRQLREKPGLLEGDLSGESDMVSRMLRALHDLDMVSVEESEDGKRYKITPFGTAFIDQIPDKQRVVEVGTVIGKMLATAIDPLREHVMNYVAVFQTKVDGGVATMVVTSLPPDVSIAAILSNTALGIASADVDPIHIQLEAADDSAAPHE